MSIVSLPRPVSRPSPPGRAVTGAGWTGSSLVMTLVEDRECWAALVCAAQRGDARAWPALIDRFEDIAVASAVGLSGDLDEAPDIAQEAFVLAFRHIDDLQDPAAFPAWLLRLVRTATNRRTRRHRIAAVSLDTPPGGQGMSVGLVDPAAGPEEVVLAAVAASEVRAAVECLPEGERCVVALHYLGGMPYAEVAAFLGITVPAVKKRAWSARRRLKELLPVVADALAAARPSGTESFRDTILLFQALRSRDADGLARLLSRNPSLATATEDWSPVEGFESRLGFSDRATALIRAAGTGDLRLVRLLVEAGAPVDDACLCAGHESALWAAVNIGATDVVDYLLDHGASVAGGAFEGEVPALHVAVYRQRHDLVRRLLTAGADPKATDAHGRIAADWGAIAAAPRAVAHDGNVLWTRIRAIDLFAPLRRGALVHIPPAYGLGAIRAVLGLVDALAPARWWVVGFEHGPYEPVELERDALERDMAGTVELVGPGDPADRRRRFAESLQRLAATPGPKVVTCVPAPGYEHDVTVSLPGLAANPSVLATVMLAPYTPEPVTVPEALPEGFGARITFDP
ncbi:MAG TPA: sigma-70 family RNA polymerase sigma factor, partial [Acidimicrobiales bacterium]|nr:sigma-70 family RNA polymerase sigma factor [Acidimicrobiales bacterium]